MFRSALSLACAGLALLATPALAEPARNLGITVAPLGAYVLQGDAEGAPTVGYSAGLGWAYRKPGAVLEVGGHLASSRHLTEVTPMSVRVVPLGDTRVRPFLGVGASMLVPHSRPQSVAPDTLGSRVLQLGFELCGGVGVELGENLFLSAEARYQNFSARGSPFSGERQSLRSTFLGLGMHL
ncbi:hypothetical protein D7W82_31810 [Corallococcus sp. CA049B]|uniref:hypothetical protein n=1 Tax=Corallococcus sp. CA049B TaxID=2316730 RepID=UPI000EA146EC|nr:hypothetical protein [Corallococcus sp. CA049B]RKG78764.1 hypothetical protein D7W82_31810 [Corallococcus sp. CA049B]